MRVDVCGDVCVWMYVWMYVTCYRMSSRDGCTEMKGCVFTLADPLTLEEGGEREVREVREVCVCVRESEREEDVKGGAEVKGGEEMKAGMSC